MWHKLQEFSQKPFAKFLKKLIGDPVQLYAVFLVTTVMSYYHWNMNWLYTILAVFISWGMMRFYDFVAKHKYIGPVLYLVYMAAGMEIVRVITEWGKIDYPITFLVWFLTPQNVVSFSFWYTIAIYLLMLGFLTSTVYYFSKATYRMSMQFLIMLIPLSLYAKEGLQMPAILVIMLLASYFLLMVYCRQLHNLKEVRYLSSFQGSMSIIVYVLAFSIVAAIVPKPTIKADREFIENAMSYSSWSDVLMDAISMFTDTTDNTVGSSNNTRTLYYVSSPESLRLKTQTYSYYSENDSWNAIRHYDYPNQKLNQYSSYKPQDLLQAIVNAASQNAEFAETYHLSDISGITLPEQSKKACSVISVYQMEVLPVSTRISDVSQCGAESVSLTNTFWGTKIDQLANFYYYSDTYANNMTVSRILEKLSGTEYQQLLIDAQAVLQNSSPEQAELLKQVQQECADAYEYLDLVQEKDFQSKAVSELAARITKGLTSDFAKAQAIENYFSEQDFIYDMAYKKEVGENVETFLTQSQTGVCYEYATAMVLLCRSAGLPARYTQGYNLSEMYKGKFRGLETNYVIKVRDAHAFPEVYISGYGWLSFEPTVPSMDLEGNTEAENKNVTRWGFVLLGFSILAGGIWVCMPYLREMIFRKRTLNFSPDKSASAIFCRMRKQMRLSDSVTVQELAQHSAVFYSETALFTAFDQLLYGHESAETTTSQELMFAYEKWQTSYRLYLKEQAQKRKLEAKQQKQHQPKGEK